MAAGVLVPLYGSLAIHSYGLCILVGVLLFLWAIQKNKQFQTLFTGDQFLNLITYSIILGVLGGRFLYLVGAYDQYAHWLDMFKLWEDGYSSLGTVLTLLIFAPAYCKYQKIPTLRAIDLIALYLPIVHVATRIGCFTAGCCYGVPTSVPWATVAFDGQLVHPTQLYSVAMWLLIFGFLMWIVAPRVKSAGSIVSWYLILTGFERFFVEFWCGDTLELHSVLPLTWYQLIALGISATGLLLLYLFSTTRNSQQQ